MTMKYISVTDHLPENGVNVLVYDKNTNTYDIAYLKQRSDGALIWLSKNGVWSVLVTHWLPLPEFDKL